ncbi:hypothetical protein [Ancylobacter terrae]|uniref:hypothetical protein n=1 Tax=Ancylobacter sp. sgz301288 TaxID=3342077 RepID=UPI00385BD156
MSVEPVIRGRHPVLATALFAGLNVALVAGIAALVLVGRFETEMREGARYELGRIGGSVARSLAMQYQKAVDYGIPLDALPGVQDQLADTLARTSGITRIALLTADGRELGAAGVAEEGDDTVAAPIAQGGQGIARIEVATSPAALANAFATLRLGALAAVALASLAAALAGALLAGRSLARRSAEFAATLAALAASRFAAPVPPMPGAGRMAWSFRAFGERQREIRERRFAFDAYADELLAVDFDDRLRPEIERIRAELGLERMAPPPAAEEA